MLVSLHIRDVVLITDVLLKFSDGLCVLTGETGAGKSILLDSLGLALGVRAEMRLIRPHASLAQVIAVFDVDSMHPATEVLRGHGVDDGHGHLILRRELGIDGRSRAFINDCPVSIGFLRQVGALLVEIHSQFDNQRLLDVAHHGDILDRFGGLLPLSAHVQDAYDAWRLACDALAIEQQEQEKLAQEEAYVRYVHQELDLLSPAAGEGASLEQLRLSLLSGSKTIDTLSVVLKALSFEGVDAGLQRAYKGMDKVQNAFPDKAHAICASLDAALLAVDTARLATQALLDSMAHDGRSLEEVEERLFALRSLARKHRVSIDDLPTLLDNFTQKISLLTNGNSTLMELQDKVDVAYAHYESHALSLRSARLACAKDLDSLVAGSLSALRLDHATFATAITPLEPISYGSSGIDRVVFLVAPNRGLSPAPLHHIASGGEMARFMLALKVALAATDTIPTMIFDEIDAGVGGAVADCVGERLVLLSQSFQVLVVTHAHQIAARARRHFKVLKQTFDEETQTSVSLLDDEQRIVEVARMMSGVSLTPEAIATAQRLIDDHRRHVDRGVHHD